MFIYTMSLRLMQWRRVFGGCTHRARVGAYARSSEWQEYLIVLREDARRCNNGNASETQQAFALLLEYSSEHRCDGYWQGYLYLAYPLVHVMPLLERLPALMLVLGALRVYGPHGHQHGFALVRLRAARLIVRGNSRAVSWLKHPMFCTMLCYRWLFILFGQMFEWSGCVPPYLLQVWDFLLADVVSGLHKRLCLFARCAVREYCLLVPEQEGVLEDFARMFEHRWRADSVVRILQHAYITARAEGL